MSYLPSNCRINLINNSVSWRAVTSATYAVSEFSELPGTYGVQLQDQPDPTTVSISGYTQVAGMPNAGEYCVSAADGKIFFNVANNGANVTFGYNGAGTISTISNIQSAFAAIQATLNNAKWTLSAGPTFVLTFTAAVGAISSANPVYVIVPDPTTSGSYVAISIISALTISLPASTENRRVSAINTTDGQATFSDATTHTPNNGTAAGIEWFAYILWDGANARLAISRSSKHTHVPANYAYNLSATSLGTCVPNDAGVAGTWDAMLIGGTTSITPANCGCACLGPIMTATVSGGSSNAGWFSACALVADSFPRWDYRRSSIAEHSVFMVGGNSYGSTDVKIRKYSTMSSRLGTAAQPFITGGTVASGAVGGLEIRITEDGPYAFTWTDNPNSAVNMAVGFSINSTQRTTSIHACTNTTVRGPQWSVSASNGSVQSGFTEYLTAGTIVRPHGDGTSGGSNAINFKVCKVS